MSRNLVRELRLKAGLSQQALAGVVGTSQQQIARIESGGQSVKIDMALRIASALNCDLVQVFPETRGLLGEGKAKKSRDELVELHYDRESVERFDAAGVDLDPATWTIQLRLRGGTSVGFAIPTAEAQRLRRNIADVQSWAPFFVFDSSAVTAAININHLLFYHELWDAHTPEDWHDDRIPAEEVCIWLTDSAEPLTLSVPPDDDAPGDDPDEGQLRHVLYMVQTMVEPDEFLTVIDEDGEYAFFRAHEVALLTVPRRLIDPELDEALYEAEYGRDDDVEEDGTVSQKAET